jgi:6-phosphogluconolactonase (cycloisomerase 2 family)
VSLALGIAACGKDNTIDYLFVANAKNNPGQINVYLVDSESGSLVQILDSPYPSGAANGGRNPVSMVALEPPASSSSNVPFLYVLNHDDNTIVQFEVGTDAKLYPEHTYNTPGGSPTAMKIGTDSKGASFLYVLDAFQAQYNATNPGPGAVVVYQIMSDGSLGTGTSYPVCNNPVDLAVLPNFSAVYVVNDPASQPPKLANTVASTSVGANGTSTITYPASGACAADSGQVTAFSINSTPGSSSEGALTAVAGSPFTAGSAPTAIVSSANSSYLYLVDLNLDTVGTFSIGGNLGLTEAGSVGAGGSGPNALTLDPSGQYLYVANYNSNNVSGFSLNAASGLPTMLTGMNAGTFDVGTGPTYVFIEPSAGKYLYAADFVDSTVYATEIDSSTGSLNAVEGTPFPAAGQLTAIAATIHHKVAQN